MDLIKVALVYDRVNKWGGAERVLLTLHELFPDAPLFTSVYDPKKADWAKIFPKIKTSFLQKIPYFQDKHELLGTFMPAAFELFDLTGFDFVISITSEAAKGIITKPKTKHLCYCLTPTRYLWSAYDIYFPKKSILRNLAKPVVEYLRKWEKIAAQRPDAMIAISTAVKNRIKKYYDRDSIVIFPPIDNSFFVTPLYNGVTKRMRKYYLIVSRLVPYKKVDLAIKAFNKLGYPLIIIGNGLEEGKLKNMAKKNIKFIRQVSDEELIKYYQGAKALIMPQEEDFGIVAIEAQAMGTPVIAYKAGGVLDTVIEGKTGLFFEKQSVKSLTAAVKKFNRFKFNKNDLIKNAVRFSKEKFKKEFLDLIKIKFGVII
jgi:glycosyltransferase involved in cell wall biosynthesis